MDETKQKATTQKKKATPKNYYTVHGKCFSRNSSKTTAVKSSYGEWIGKPERLKTWRKNSIYVLAIEIQAIWQARKECIFPISFERRRKIYR